MILVALGSCGPGLAHHIRLPLNTRLLLHMDAMLFTSDAVACVTQATQGLIGALTGPAHDAPMPDAPVGTDAGTNASPDGGDVEMEDAGRLLRIATAAEAAGRPRITTSDIARRFVPPDLNKLRGKKKRAKRNGDTGEPRLWYWQMTGEAWNLDGASFHTARVAWSRLIETEEQSESRRGKDLARHQKQSLERREGEAMEQRRVEELEAAPLRDQRRRDRQNERRFRSAARPAPQNSGHVWVGEDGNPLGCRCPPEHGGPHLTAAHCVRDHIVRCSPGSMYSQAIVGMRQLTDWDRQQALLQQQRCDYLTLGVHGHDTDGIPRFKVGDRVEILSYEIHPFFRPSTGLEWLTGTVAETWASFTNGMRNAYSWRLEDGEFIEVPYMIRLDYLPFDSELPFVHDDERCIRQVRSPSPKSLTTLIT